MSSPPDLEDLSPAELKTLVIALLTRVNELERTVAAQRDEIARLKKVPGRPRIKPSGMEDATQPKPSSGAGKPRRGGGKKTAQRVIHEDRVIKAAVPNGSRFKGYADFVVQDLVLCPRVVRYRRERWLTPDGKTITAPLPPGVSGHFGADLRRFVLTQHHQGQVTGAIEAQVTSRPDATIAELRAWLAETHQVSASTGLMWKTLAALDLTLKKVAPRCRAGPSGRCQSTHRMACQAADFEPGQAGLY
jgi:hypothetical protein